jgi:predicted RNA-binding protein YlqC (UPF0109 family)
VSELVRYLVMPLVAHPEAVRVNEVQGEAAVLLELTVDPSDLAKVRGPEGETLQAIRTVLSASSGRRKAILELNDGSTPAASQDEAEPDAGSDAAEQDSEQE